mmetsp:Transcript_40216/g.83778  ORF Transcript_40216/g.83778 Transcript_40216/m.83778 type:complete len:157 (+) Transcript_40216:155-625(+)
MEGSSSQIQDMEIDASIDFCCWLSCFPCHFGGCPYKTILLLEKEEVTRTDTNLCGTNSQKRPYGELGSVGKGNCCCCVNVVSGIGEISPGCGCEEEKVDLIVIELKKRMRIRGDTAQIQRAEETLKRLDDIDAKIDIIMKHLNVPESMKIDAETRC